MMNIYNRIASYFISLCVITLLFVYILKLPDYITQSPKLIQEYYYKNALSSFILDIFLFAAYIFAAMYVGTILNINQSDNAQNLIIMILTTISISGSFMTYFKLGYNSGTFFSRWFNAVGYKAVLYDIIIVCSVYTMMMIIYNNFF